jgi:hypothetical protein
MKTPKLWIACCLGTLVACRPAAPQGTSAGGMCAAKDGSKYAPGVAKEIEERLGRESSRVSWTDVPDAYRPWAVDHLALKVSAAASTLAGANNCREVEAAAAKVAGMGKRVAEVAKKCSDEQCLTKQTKATQIEQDLDLALCPLYPFC